MHPSQRNISLSLTVLSVVINNDREKKSDRIMPLNGEGQNKLC